MEKVGGGWRRLEKVREKVRERRLEKEGSERRFERSGQGTDRPPAVENPSDGPGRNPRKPPGKR